ncbi:MAG: hypothetical protein ACKOEO_19305 [Planctomycetaceae bacterium]
MGLFLPEIAPGWRNGPPGTPWLRIRLAAVAADWLRDRQNATSFRSQLTPDGPRRPAS